MKVDVQKQESCLKMFRVEFDKDEIKKAKVNAYKKDKSRYALPGFRKGKVPMQVIEMHYGKDVFLMEAAEKLVNEGIMEILTTNEKLVGEPSVDIVDLQGETAIFDVEFAKLPDVKIENYTGLDIEAPNNEIDEAKMEQEINALIEKNTRYETVDTEIEDGYQVNIDFQGKVDGEEFEGGTSQGYDLKIGSKSFIEGFEEQLIGKKAGEAVDVNVTFPEDYHSEDLKGKDAVFTVTINEVKKPIAPELDDDLISDTTDFETVDEYKADIRKYLEAEKRLKDEKDFRDAILSKLMESNEIELGDKLINTEVDRMIQDITNELQGMGVDYNMYLQFMGKTDDEVRAEQKEIAIDNLKRSIISMSIIEQEDIEVKDKDEARKLFKEMLELQGTDYEEVKEHITDEYLESMNPQIVEFKLFEMLKEKNLKK